MRWVLPLGLALVLVGASAQAEDGPYVVTWRKSQILRLDRDATNVVVGEPGTLEVTLETPRMVFLFGKTPGETNLTILDSSHRPVFDHAVVVAPEESRHVFIHSVTKTAGMAESVVSCVATRCVKVTPPDGTATGAAAAPSPGPVGAGMVR